MGDRFWTRLAVAGCALAALMIFWPALTLLFRAQWIAGVIATLGTGAILYVVWLQRSR